MSREFISRDFRVAFLAHIKHTSNKAVSLIYRFHPNYARWTGSSAKAVGVAMQGMRPIEKARTSEHGGPPCISQVASLHGHGNGLARPRPRLHLEQQPSRHLVDELADVTGRYDRCL
jgi:hypothetical protein